MSTTVASRPQEQAAETAEDKPRSKVKLLLVLVLVLALGGAGWFFLLRPSDAEAAPKPGEVVALEPVQINLADGHYLRIGVALQLVEGAHEADGSKALDAVIDLFSGREVTELTKGGGRQKLKKELVHELEERYHGEVIDVYLTEFVTQ